MDIPTVPLRARRDGWTVTRQRIFVRALAEDESVAAAARRVGMSRASAYKLRQRPQAAAFRAAWDAAVAQPFRQIEVTALDHAINGVVVVLDKDGVRETRRRPCSARLLIGLMKRLERLQALAAKRARSSAAAGGTAGGTSGVTGGVTRQNRQDGDFRQLPRRHRHPPAGRTPPMPDTDRPPRERTPRKQPPLKQPP